MFKTFFFTAALTGAIVLSHTPFHSDESGEDQKRIRIAFYNVENLFDTLNDSLKRDDEFTPEGSKNWTYGRYQTKLSHIYKTILALGEWEPPAIVGLCEVENYAVLSDLVEKTPLKKFNYEIVHKESPDLRGIDVAFLYRKDLFRPLEYEPISVGGGPPDSWTSREILYVKGVVFETDTLHVFVNHWPSRYGGRLETEKKRLHAAGLLRIYTDSIMRHDENARILIMGDLNDDPDDRSIRFLTAPDSRLVNLMTAAFQRSEGTLVHTDGFLQWHLFDQIIASEPLISNSTLRIVDEEARIFRPKWLLDKKGERPYRTYQGPAYIGGFSDHLPVYVDLTK